jgi:glycosyltransferase involved in cell wall biosynthesis
MAASPLVSIVVATFNCSHLLRHAIQSVLDSTFDDWELIVVGDACTDDTADVVDRFQDRRLSFVNLPENSGDQAAPNNRGIALSRGKYIAFLNQDDMYFADHLGESVDALERSGADLVWSASAAVRPATEAALQDDDWQAEVWGISPVGSYSPLSFYCASSWMLRRELCDRVGPWRPPDTLWVTPSQDWLFRAWRAGARIEFRPRISVLLIVSGLRKDSYVARQTFEHEYFSRRMRDDPHFRERLFESAAIHTAETHLYKLFKRPAAAILRSAAYPIYALFTRLGLHPISANLMLWPGGQLRLGRKGQNIRTIRKYTGLKD